MQLFFKTFIALIVVILLLFYFEVFSVYAIEESIYRNKVDRQIKKVNTAKVPVGYLGEVYTYKDGWLVVLIGNSKWQHGRWYYHVAIDSTNRIYVSKEQLRSILPIKLGVASYSPHNSLNEIKREPVEFEDVEFLNDASLVLAKKGFKLK